MRNGTFSGCSEEIKRCKKLYKEFGEAEVFLTGICKEADQYFQKNPVDVIPLFDAEEAENKIRSGNSIKLNPPLVKKQFGELFKKATEVMTQVNKELKHTAKTLDDKLEQFLKASSDELSKEDVYNFRDSLIKETVLEKDMATFLFSFLLSSFYRQQLDSIKEVIRTDLWEGGECPLCGERPHFALLTSDSGAKQLECWLCGTEWIHTRVKCPFCDNEDHEKLGYFTIEDSEICRVNVCNSCCQYYKVFDARKFHVGEEVVLTIHNLATLDYDLLARQEGYLPGSGLEWVNDSEVSDRQD